MVSRFSCLRPCSIKSMFYMLSLISLFVGLRVWMLDSLDFTESVKYALTAFKLFSPEFKPDADTKYVLSWDQQYIGSESGSIFSTLNCSVKNCVFTGNRDLLNISAFDAIVFGDSSLNSNRKPKERNPSQIFVFMSIESSYMHPACELYNDDYFNWTFTYRFDSDVLWRNFVVRNASGAIIAPATHVAWTKDDSHLRPEIRSILRRKTSAVVWFVNECSTEGYDYILRLQKHLYHFDLQLDKHMHCSKMSRICDSLIQNYRFILSFENSLAEDYLSERILDGYRNHAVPVVYGGANYSRFLPPGSFIDARERHPYNLAHAIYEASKNQLVFQSYFKWTNKYSIEEWGTKTHSSLCDLCAALHEDRAHNAPAKKNFRVWWNSPNSMHRCLSADYLSTNEKHINYSDKFSVL